MSRRTDLALLIPFAFLAVPLAASDGDLDDSFWSDGKYYVGAAGTFDVNAVVTAPDGRVVVVGTHDPGDGVREWFWRAVGNSGSSTSSACYFTPLGAATQGRAEAADFDRSGKLLLAGSALYDFDRLAVARFSYPDCALDESFDGDGYLQLDVPGGFESLHAIAVHPVSGRIVLGGYQEDALSGETDMVVALVTNSGSLAQSFSGDGWLTLDFADAGNDDYVARVAFDDSGGIFAAGTTYYDTSGTEADWIIAKFDLSGALDPTFDGNGIRAIAFDLGAPDYRLDTLHGLALDANSGKLVLAGEAQSAAAYSLAIARLLPSGALDSTFSDDGKVDLAFDNGHSRLHDVAVDGLGRVLVAGFLKYPGDDADFLAMRFRADGAPDPIFGFGGRRTIAFDLGPDDHDDDYGRALTIQAGRLVVAGAVERNSDSESGIGIARLDVALILADSFESGGISLWSSSPGPK